MTAVPREAAAGRRRSPGRPPSLTAEVQRQLLALVRGGIPVRAACRLLAVPRRTYYDAPYRELREQVEQARGQGEVALVLRIARESTTRWQSAAWLLERIAPERYGRLGDRPATDGEPQPFRSTLASPHESSGPST
jgi:hypothetical protein